MHIGTLLYTWFNGKLVGIDEFSNRYYRGKGKRLHGRERRWVVFKGKAEASKVPPEWHAWLHRMTDAPPTEKPLAEQPWQKPHLPNLSGTAHAYRPPGNMAKGDDGMPPPYEPWRP